MLKVHPFSIIVSSFPYNHHYSAVLTASGTDQCRTEKLTGKQQKV